MENSLTTSNVFWILIYILAAWILFVNIILVKLSINNMMLKKQVKLKDKFMTQLIIEHFRCIKSMIKKHNLINDTKSINDTLTDNDAMLQLMSKK